MKLFNVTQTQATCKKHGFYFIIRQLPKSSPYPGRWVVSTDHVRKDIRYNSLWRSETFTTMEDAKQWCENFKPENYACIGKDVQITVTNQ